MSKKEYIKPELNCVIRYTINGSIDVNWKWAKENMSTSEYLCLIDFVFNRNYVEPFIYAMAREVDKKIMENCTE